MSEREPPAASLSVSAPDALRGLLYQARFRIRAIHELRDARLVLSQGWLEGMQVNTIEPTPVGEASSDGRLSLDLGHVPAGRQHVLFMQLQVDPTYLGSRSHGVALFDGDRKLLSLYKSVPSFP